MSIDRPTFPLQRFVESYDAEQVDRAVEMVRDNIALPQPRIDRRDIEALRFTPVRRSGYSMTAVDDWLDEVAAELDRRAGVRPAAPASAPATSVSPATPGVVVDLDARDAAEDSEMVRLLVKVAVVVVLAVLFYVTFA